MSGQYLIAGFLCVLWHSRVAVVLIWLLAASHAFAQTYRMTMTDFSVRQVTVQSMTDAGLVFQVPGGQPQTLLLEKVLSLSASNDAASASATSKSRHATPTAPWVLYLKDGQRLAGVLSGFDGSSLSIRTTAFTPGKSTPSKQLEKAGADVLVPVDIVSHVRRVQSAAANQKLAWSVSADESQDVLFLSNGDKLSGVVAGISQDQLTVIIDGQDALIPLSSVADWRLASAASSSTPAKVLANDSAQERRFLLQLADGSLFWAAEVALSATGVAGCSYSSTLGGLFEQAVRGSVSWSELTYLENANTAVRWLTRQTPISADHAPVVGQVFHPKIMGGLEPHALVMADQTFSRCISMRPRGYLAYDLPPDASAVRFYLALGGSPLTHPLASVKLRILAGDKELAVYEMNEPGKVLGPFVQPVANAKTLRFELTEGPNLDAQDELLILDPAIIR